MRIEKKLIRRKLATDIYTFLLYHHPELTYGEMEAQLKYMLKKLKRANKKEKLFSPGRYIEEKSKD